MNDRKVAFIIATNDEQYLGECIYYINRLTVPDGFETDVIAVREANSICEAYNAAMHSSDARYKVYLHQDVFIINTNFIRDMTDTFAIDHSIGMLGVIGAENMPNDAYVVNSWDSGGTLLFNGDNGGIRMHGNKKPLKYVSCIDGMLMITNHDIEWREDIFDGWDFYDLSQSMEFRKAGYKIAVPDQKSPWCMHDLAYLSVGRYNYYRKIFCKEYGLCTEFDNDLLFMDELDKNLERVHQITKLAGRDIEHGRFAEAGNKLEYIKIFRAFLDNGSALLRTMLTIHGEETLDGVQCFMKPGESIEELKRKYIDLKFLLYRAQFDCPKEDYIPALRESIENNIISQAAIRVAIHKNVYDKTKVYKKLLMEGIPAGKTETLENFVCPICGNKQSVITYANSNGYLRKDHLFSDKDTAYTGERKTEIHCAGCGASADERAVVNQLKKTVEGENLRAVCLSYAPVISEWTKTERRVSEFITSEKDYSGKDYEDELQSFWGLESDSCDYVIAIDTFNNCEDDKKTMSEIYRILKRGGKLIVTNNMDTEAEKTIEDISIEAEERVLHWQVFGGERKRRSYAIKDFEKRLGVNGFDIRKISRCDMDKDFGTGLGLPEKYQMYVCSKNK